MARRFYSSQLTQERLSLQREAVNVQTWRWGANPTGGGVGTGDMTKAVYDTNNDGYVDEVKFASSALPAAAAAYEGRFHYYAPAGGTAGYLYFCVKNSVGGYEWIYVAQSS
jgi:hypothetical protein